MPLTLYMDYIGIKYTFIHFTKIFFYLFFLLKDDQKKKKQQQLKEYPKNGIECKM